MERLPTCGSLSSGDSLALVHSHACGLAEFKRVALRRFCSTPLPSAYVWVYLAYDGYSARNDYGVE